MNALNILYIGIEEIVPYENNAKIHSEKQVENIAKSIERFGWTQPVVIDADGVVVIGHGRVQAAKLLGLTEIPCIVVDSLSEQEIKALRLADNKLNESAWDFDLLAEELENLDFDDFEFEWDLPLERPDLDQFFEDAPEPKEKEPKTIKCPHCGGMIEV